MKRIEIWIDTDDESMIGKGSWDGYDIEASTDNFFELVQAKVKQEYPDCSVTIRAKEHGNWVEVDGDHYHDQVDFIEALVSDVFNEANWFIPL